ncbi:AraC-like DNA-binding protein [Nocardia sp. GAS34]|uniref:AraC family transcriptional regulator ligand-binding domain-containing protein n=1 Tax=unclassified Nocardia TaxID=2637762 RepID=UPI003D1B78A5
MRQQPDRTRQLNSAQTSPRSAVADPAASQIQGTISPQLSRLVLGTARYYGIVDSELARLPALQPIALADEFSRPSTLSVIRLWEMIDARSDEAGRFTADHAPLGALHVWDYLFTSGSTFVSGAQDAADYLRLVVDPSARMEVRDNGGQVTLTFSSEAQWTDAAPSIHEFLLALLLRRSREAVGSPIVPVHIGFAHTAPRRQQRLAEAFGTSRLDFDTPLNTITFLTSDIERLPPRDPALAAILREYARHVAATLRPQPDSPWLEHFRRVLAAELLERPTSLREIAPRLAISPRTLQRRLAEADTTWRDELDIARRSRADRLRRGPRTSHTALADSLGYTTDRSVRRALARWQLDRTVTDGDVTA